MERKWKERYSQKFRSRTVERMNACENILRLLRELGVHRRLLYKWRDQVDPTDADGESDISGEKASTMKSKTRLQGSLSIERMCQLAQ